MKKINLYSALFIASGAIAGFNLSTCDHNMEASRLSDEYKLTNNEELYKTGLLNGFGVTVPFFSSAYFFTKMFKESGEQKTKKL